MWVAGVVVRSRVAPLCFFSLTITVIMMKTCFFGQRKK